MKSVGEKIYQITSKVISSGNKEATAFLINKKHAVTARHAVSDNLEDNSLVVLEFLINQGKKTLCRKAKVIDDNKDLDIAILQLEDEFDFIIDWIPLNSADIELNDEWETVGYPVDWNDQKEGSKYCYLRGDIFHYSEYDATATYDIHLASNYIKEEWTYGFKGLSGAPVVIDGTIAGIIITEEYSAIKSSLKAVSIKKAITYLKKLHIQVESIPYGTTNNTRIKTLLTKRMEEQKVKCQALFEKVEYQHDFANLDLVIDTYFLKYGKRGEKGTIELAEYIATSLNQYACSLIEIKTGMNDPRNMMKIFQKTQECLSQIKNDGKLGKIILWMLLEGILGVPKTIDRIVYTDSSIATLNGIHIGIDIDDKLTFYIGDGKLGDDLFDATEEVIEKIIEELNIENGKINIEDDIFITDNYIYENLNSCKLKEALTNFITPYKRDWSEIKFEITIFTAYNSNLIKNIEQLNLDKIQIENYIRNKYIAECVKNNEYIYELVSKNSNINRLKINWIILPFNTVQEFEELVLHEAEGGYK